MANAFSGQQLADLAKLVRDVQGGQKSLNRGIDAQLRERCHELTHGLDRAAYVASLTDVAARGTAISDWMAVEGYGKGHTPQR